ncbi:MAG: hypothetical protein GF398_18425 [Chitinivibrionales bacterium]|nr:hypothetical protein [Chitinivibrionales bacterium]
MNDQLVMLLAGLLGGILLSSLVWGLSIILIRSGKTRSRKSQEQIGERLGLLEAEIDKLLSAHNAGELSAQHLKPSLGRKLDSLSQSLKTHMHRIDTYMARYYDTILRQHWSFMQELDKAARAIPQQAQQAAPPAEALQVPAPPHLQASAQQPPQAEPPRPEPSLAPEPRVMQDQILPQSTDQPTVALDMSEALLKDEEANRQLQQPFAQPEEFQADYQEYSEEQADAGEPYATEGSPEATMFMPPPSFDQPADAASAPGAQDISPELTAGFDESASERSEQDYAAPDQALPHEQAGEEQVDTIFSNQAPQVDDASVSFGTTELNRPGLDDSGTPARWVSSEDEFGAAQAQSPQAFSEGQEEDINFQFSLNDNLPLQADEHTEEQQEQQGYAEESWEQAQSIQNPFAQPQTGDSPFAEQSAEAAGVRDDAPAQFETSPDNAAEPLAEAQGPSEPPAENAQDERNRETEWSDVPTQPMPSIEEGTGSFDLAYDDLAATRVITDIPNFENMRSAPETEHTAPAQPPEPADQPQPQSPQSPQPEAAEPQQKKEDKGDSSMLSGDDVVDKLDDFFGGLS